MRRSKVLATALISSVLLVLPLSACGTSSSGSSSSAVTTPAANAELLKDVKVTPGENGAAPKVDFNKPLTINQSAIKVVTEGTGDVIKENDTIQLHSIALNPQDGSTLNDDYAQATQEAVVNASLQAQAPLAYNTFLGAKVGSFVAFGVPAQPASQSAAAQPAALVIYQIMSAAAPNIASPDDVKQLDSAGKLPAVTFNDKQVPSVTIPAGDPPAPLVVKVLTEGTGQVLKATDTIKANYTGWTWADSKQFDSSYDKGAPISFALNQVIQGWTLGLTGLKVGSTVLLVIPANMAYGTTPSQGQPAGTLVFVVNIVSLG